MVRLKPEPNKPTELLFDSSHSEMLEYKGYKIAGESFPMFMSGCESLGTVDKRGRLGPIIEGASLEGKVLRLRRKLKRMGWSWRGTGVDKESSEL